MFLIITGKCGKMTEWEMDNLRTNTYCDFVKKNNTFQLSFWLRMNDWVKENKKNTI